MKTDELAAEEQLDSEADEDPVWDYVMNDLPMNRQVELYESIGTDVAYRRYALATAAVVCGPIDSETRAERSVRSARCSRAWFAEIRRISEVARELDQREKAGHDMGAAREGCNRLLMQMVSSLGWWYSNLTKPEDGKPRGLGR